MHTYQLSQVAITGIGAVTPIGTGNDFWPAALSGKSGVGPITLFDTMGFETRTAAEVKEFNPLNYMDKRTVKRTDPVTQFAIVAAMLAITDAGLSNKHFGKNCGVMIGSVAGGTRTFEDEFSLMTERRLIGPKLLDIFTVPKTISSMVSANVAIILGAKAISMGATSACATGAHAIGIASDIIRHNQSKRPQDRTNIMLAGASEACVTRMGIGGFQQLGILTKGKVRPFDKNRDGFSIGEGCVILVLEDFEHALARGAKIYALLSSFAANCDAYHIVKPMPNGERYADCMQMALGNAIVNGSDELGLDPNLIDFISAHGCATLLNDKAEVNAIHTTFGSRADSIPVTSVISMLGHCLGAIGAMRAALTVLSIYYGQITLTINYQTPDPECRLNIVTETLETNLKFGMANAWGFGGQNAVLIFQKGDG